MAHLFQFQTERLTINPLSRVDNKFLYKLLNTKGWLEFIGDRQIYSEEKALLYIDEIINNEYVSYWVVESKKEKKKMGVITFIFRERAEYPDIGFAFLPEYEGKGYAYEATFVVLEKLRLQFSIILAVTLSHNQNSIELLKKLGFNLKEENEEGSACTFEIKSITKGKNDLE